MARASYDLEDRLIAFAADVCRICDRLPHTVTGRHVGGQLVRSGTAPLAHYGEAQGAESRRDFVHKMRVALKELRETKAWLKFVTRVPLGEVSSARSALAECDQLVAIFVSSVRTASKTG